MRWHCLHPELPDKAVLRIRTAPNSSAEVCGRVAKGKAIAAVAPEFEIADDDALSVAADGSAHAPQQWLHVAFLDEHSGEPAEGYVMASMPNGLRLLVPWEDAECINCCRVANAHAQLFADASSAAPVVGLVGDGEGVRYPYAVFGVENGRARILHDVHDDVWMEIAELEPMCVRLRHRNCFTTHAFYMLNDELPPEAQIAIRAFPSKDADTVALLSRGEAIEVVARSGSWLQVAPKQFEDGARDESWIMWETDAWTLLVEALDHRSDKCRAPLSQARDTDSAGPTQQLEDVASAEETRLDDTVALAAVESSAEQQQDDAVATIHASTEASAYLKQSDFDEDAHGLCEDAETSRVEHSDSCSESAPAPASSSWDDRPLNVRRNRVKSDASAAADACDPLESVEGECDVQPSAGSSWDDCPIRSSPQQQQQELETRSTDSDAQAHELSSDKSISSVATTADAGTADDTVQEAAENTDAPVHASHNDDSDRIEPALPSWDDTPVGGSRAPSAWDETPVGSAHRAPSAWDEMPVGGGNKQVWDEYPPGYEPEVDNDSDKVGVASSDRATAHGERSEDGNDDTEVAAEEMAVDAHEESESVTEAMQVDVESAEQPAAMTSTATASWDDVPVGGAHRAPSAWDEMPVGGGNKQVWDEYPPGFEPEVDAKGDEVDNADCGPSSAEADGDTKGAESDDEAYAEAMADDGANAVADVQVDDDATESSPATTSLAAPWDEVPVGGGRRALSTWDEVPVGGSSKRVWDEYPPDTAQIETAREANALGERESKRDSSETPSSPDAGGDDDEEMFEDTETEDVAELDEGVGDDAQGGAEVGELSLATTTTAAPWDDVPVGGGHRAPSAWDEKPVGGGSKQVWDEYPPDASAPSADDDMSVRQPACSSTPNIEMSDESQAVASVVASHSTDLVTGDRSSKGKMTLADLDDDDELVLAGAESSVEVVNVESFVAESEDGHLFSDSDDVFVLGDSENDTASDLPDDDECDHSLLEPSAVGPDDVEDDDMAMDSSDDVVHTHRAVPVWNESPIKQTARFFRDTTVGATSDHSRDNDDDSDDARACQDADVPMNDHMKNTSGGTRRFSSSSSKTSDSSLSTPRASSASFATKRTSALRDVRSRKASRVGASGSAARRPRKPEFALTEADNGGLSFLMEFGIRAYCRHKQILITSTDDASQSLFQAVVYSDDPECILETLTAAEPPCEDWMLYSPSKVRAAGSDPAHAFLDVLYAREGPSTPKPASPTERLGLRTPPHSSGARKEKIDRMFNRTPVKPRSTPTYDLIMSNADVDKILEAEFGSEACEMTILGPYKYPTLSTNRLVVPAPARSPVGGASSGDFGAASSNLMRFSSALQPSSLASESESKTSSQHPLLHDDSAAPPRALTPPLAVSVSNPLKRSASAITKTPPVPVAKTASAPSLPSAAAVSAKPGASGLPPASRFGARPSSASSIRTTSSSLRRPSPPPLGSLANGTGASASAVARPRSSLTSEPRRASPRSSLTSEPSRASPRSSLTGAPAKPAQTPAASSSSQLQRKSFLPSARPGSSIPIGTRRETLAGPSALTSRSSSSSSSLLARRTSFGFARPTSAIPKKS